MAEEHWVRPTSEADAETLFGLPMGSLPDGAMPVVAICVLKVLMPDGKYQYSVSTSGSIHLVEASAMLKVFGDAYAGLCVGGIMHSIQQEPGPIG